MLTSPAIRLLDPWREVNCSLSSPVVAWKIPSDLFEDLGSACLMVVGGPERPVEMSNPDVNLMGVTWVISETGVMVGRPFIHCQYTTL